MTKQPTVRPARAAIAAVLAFASTPLLAQVAEPSAPPPIVPTQNAPAPVTEAPAPVAAPAAPAPVMAAPSPVVQATPAPAPVVAEAAPPAPRVTPARSTVARSATVRAAPVTERASAPAEVAPVRAMDEAPVTPATTAPEVAQTAAPIETAPAVPASSATADSNGLEWGLVGGAVVVLGGLGFMAMRRRRRPEQDEVLLTERAPLAEAAPAYAPLAAAPIYVAPPRDRPVMAATGTHGSLEAHAAEAPSPANPFLTRKNRLRRAHFMLRQQETGRAIPNAPVAAKPVQAQEQRRASPVYDFGGGMTQRRGFRPATI